MVRETSPSRQFPATSSIPAASASTPTTRRRRLRKPPTVSFRSRPTASSIPARHTPAVASPRWNSGGIQGRHDQHCEFHGVRQCNCRQFCDHQRRWRRRYPGVQFRPRQRHDCQPCRTIVARDFYGIAGSSPAVVMCHHDDGGLQHHLWLARHPGNQPATAIAAAEASTVTVTTASGIRSIQACISRPAARSRQAFRLDISAATGLRTRTSTGRCLSTMQPTFRPRPGLASPHSISATATFRLSIRTGTSVSGAQFGISVGSSVSGTASPSNMSINVGATRRLWLGSLYGLAAITANNPTGGNISISTGSGDAIHSGGTGINANVSASSTRPLARSQSRRGKARSIPVIISSREAARRLAFLPARHNGPLSTAVHGNVVLDNSATIKAVSGAGINLYNNGVGSISATLRAGSSVTAAQGGVNAFSAGGGNITIDNRGTITRAASASTPATAPAIPLAPTA